jgi:hypothetical protein
MTLRELVIASGVAKAKKTPDITTLQALMQLYPDGDRR